MIIPFIWKLVSGIEYFVGMHDVGALFKVLNGFIVVAAVEVHDCSVQIIVFFVEDVFLIVVGFFFVSRGFFVVFFFPGFAVMVLFVQFV